MYRPKALPICLSAERHLVRSALLRALLRTGIRMPMRMAMMPMTTRSSTSVNARRRGDAIERVMSFLPKRMCAGGGRGHRFLVRPSRIPQKERPVDFLDVLRRGHMSVGVEDVALDLALGVSVIVAFAGAPGAADDARILAVAVAVDVVPAAVGVGGDGVGRLLRIAVGGLLKDHVVGGIGRRD